MFKSKRQKQKSNLSRIKNCYKSQRQQSLNKKSSQCRYSFQKPMIKKDAQQMNLIEKHKSKDQDQNLAMFLLNLTKTHSQQFLNAIDNMKAQKQNIIYIYKYLMTHFKQLSLCTIYYIISSLLDYKAIEISDKHPQTFEVQSNVMNTVCFELAEQYQMEKLWIDRVNISAEQIFKRIKQRQRQYISLKDIKKYVATIMQINTTNRQETSTKTKNLLRLKLQQKLNLYSNQQLTSKCKIKLNEFCETVARLKGINNSYSYKLIQKILQKNALQKQKSQHLMQIAYKSRQNRIISQYAKYVSTPLKQNKQKFQLSFGDNKNYLTNNENQSDFTKYKQTEDKDQQKTIKTQRKYRQFVSNNDKTVTQKKQLIQLNLSKQNNIIYNQQMIRKNIEKKLLIDRITQQLNFIKKIKMRDRNKLFDYL